METPWAINRNGAAQNLGFTISKAGRRVLICNFDVVSVSERVLDQSDK
jgi:hypothetical protein